MKVCVASHASNPYGDGFASDRIVQILLATKLRKTARASEVSQIVGDQPEVGLQMHA